jgi:hypothetical protein
MHEEFDVDPADGQPTFLHINLGGFVIECLEDVELFWDCLDDLVMDSCEEAGFVIYPIVTF